MTLESNSKMVCKPGVYRILNVVTRKSYIGSALNMSDRATGHRMALRRGKHHSQKLQRSWDKHGEAAFVFRPLLICAADDLLFYEQRAIEAFDAVRGGYNVLPFTRSGLTGFRHSPETIAKMRASAKARGMPAETIRRSQAARAGVPRSQVVRDKIAAALRGHKRTPEEIAKRLAHGVSATTKAKLAASMKRVWAERRAVHQ